jgi:hypothetical protein
MIIQQLLELEDLDTVVSNKRLFNIIWAVSGVALIELIIIICLVLSKPETIIEEKIIEVEVEKIIEVEKIVESPTVTDNAPTQKPKPTAVPENKSETTTYTQIGSYNISESDREMLARLVFLEANTESLECQKAIVSVVINRWQSGYWGSTLTDVVYAPNQFTPAKKIPNTTATQINYQAVDEVLQNGCTVPSYVLYFRANYHFNWNGYVGYTKIDDVCFGYMNRDKKD